MNNNDFNNNKNKTTGIIALILLIASIIIIFCLKNPIGYLITLITFIFTLVNRKCKHPLIEVAKWLSLILLIFCGISIFTALRHIRNVSQVIEEERMQQGYTCETRIAEMTKEYVNDLDNKPTSITIFNDNDFFVDIGRCMGFDWYVVYNPQNQTYKTYVSNKYYTTKGFDSYNAK